MGARIGRSKLFYGWVIVAAIFMIGGVSSGIRGSFAVMLKPMAADLEWDRSTIALTLSIGTFLTAILQPAVGRLVDDYGPRALYAVGSIVAALSVASLYWVYHPWQIYLVYGGLGSFAFVIMSGSVIRPAVLGQWFRRKLGLTLGLAASGVSAGNLALAPLATALVITYGWREANIILAAMQVAFVLPIALWLIKDRPAALGYLPDGDPPGPPPPGGGYPGVAAITGTTIGQAARRRQFWQLALPYFVCGLSSVMFGTHFVAFATDIGHSPMAAANAFGLMGFAGALGTLTTGYLVDKAGRKGPLAAVYLVRALAIVALMGLGGTAALYPAAMVFGFSNIASGPPTAALTADFFGQRSIGTIYGFVFLSHNVGGALGSYLGGLSFDLTGSYQAAFASAVLLLLVAAGITASIREGRPDALGGAR